MIQMKIAFFIICVYSSVNVLEVNSKPLPGGGDPPKTSTSDDNLDLNNFNPETVEYYKFAMIIYFRVLDYKYFNNNPPTDTEFSELESFTKNESELEWTKSYDRLALIGETVFKKYNQKVVSELKEIDVGTRKEALMMYYYRLINWLADIIKKAKTYGASNITFQEFILNLIKLYTVQHRLNRILAQDDQFRSEIFDDTKQLSTVQAWKNYDNEYDQATIFLLEANSIETGDTISAVYNKATSTCTNINIYEKTLNHANANPEKFEAIFNQTPSEMLSSVDMFISIKDPSKTLISEATPTQEINLSTMKGDTIKYYKHATILLVEAVTKNISKLLSNDDIPALIREVLYKYSVRYEQPYTELRYCALQKFASHIVTIMNNKSEDDSITFSDHEKAYFYRLLQWYKKVFEGQQAKCNDLTDMLTKLLRSKFKTNIITSVAKSEDKDGILNIHLDSINTFDNVLNLGKDDDDAISTLINYGNAGDTIECRKIDVYERLIPQIDENEFKQKYGKELLVTYQNIKQKLE